MNTTNLPNGWYVCGLLDDGTPREIRPGRSYGTYVSYLTKNRYGTWRAYCHDGITLFETNDEMTPFQACVRAVEEMVVELEDQLQSEKKVLERLKKEDASL
jgi:hypothetical protein